MHMTLNQIRYQELKEAQRSNRAKEAEANRSNLAKEIETHRANTVQERGNLMSRLETKRSNLAKEAETNRSNVAKEAETHRSNVEKEIDADKDRVVKWVNTASSLADSIVNGVDRLLVSPKTAKLTAMGNLAKSAIQLPETKDIIGSARDISELANALMSIFNNK